MRIHTRRARRAPLAVHGVTPSRSALTKIMRRLGATALQGSQHGVMRVVAVDHSF